MGSAGAARHAPGSDAHPIKNADAVNAAAKVIATATLNNAAT
jgi:hypothetical protein